MMNKALVLMLVVVAAQALAAPRARDLGVPFDGAPGPLNAITDVAGVTVGQVTLIQDLDDARKVRTGVTAILPRGRDSLNNPVFAAAVALNGAGELTGSLFLNESGRLEGPVMLTNTHSVGTVFEAVIAWRIAQGNPDARGYYWSDPVVGETWDGDLNDINGFHVRPEHAVQALESAVGGSVAEGNVGAGTGTTCFELKCGIGTSSRRIAVLDQHYSVGVLVQANFGVRRLLRIAGVPVGEPAGEGDRAALPRDHGSIIVVVATDAPLLPGQLARVARRAGLGLARLGSYGGDGSGDIFVAFSTANSNTGNVAEQLVKLTMLPNDQLDPLFLATVEATEEAVVNSIVAAGDMVGNTTTARALPHKTLRDALRRSGRLRD